MATIRDDKGNVEGLVGVILDITERKAAELESSKLQAERDHSRMIESLTIQLNHDLNTPLTPLFALLPIIRKQVSDPVVVRMLEICQQCTNQIKGLAGKSLDLVRLASSVNLCAAAAFALSEVKAALDRRGVTCRNEIDPELNQGAGVCGADGTAVQKPAHQCRALRGKRYGAALRGDDQRHGPGLRSRRRRGTGPEGWGSPSAGGSFPTTGGRSGPRAWGRDREPPSSSP